MPIEDPCMAKLTIIVAIDAQHGIGINNTLAWHLPEDLARFRKLTIGHAIIMGRKTFLSIGRPLPGRRNIVLTRQTDWQPDGIEVVHSLQDAIQSVVNDDAFIIGGAELYAQVLPDCCELLVTEIQADFQCDTFFPVIDRNVWQETERSTHHSEKNGFDYAFVTYQKK